MTTDQWTHQLKPYMDSLDDAKAKGKIKAVGVSCHNLDALKAAADCPWVDVVLARINPDGVKMDAPTAEVVPVLAAPAERQGDHRYENPRRRQTGR